MRMTTTYMINQKHKHKATAQRQANKYIRFNLRDLMLQHINMWMSFVYVRLWCIISSSLWVKMGTMTVGNMSLWTRKMEDLFINMIWTQSWKFSGSVIWQLQYVLTIQVSEVFTFCNLTSISGFCYNCRWQSNFSSSFI